MIVVVLTVPRSGSSMTAGILHNLGIDMGESLLEADRWNQLGFFEDRRFLALHRVMSFAHGDQRRIDVKLPAALPVFDKRTRDRYVRLVNARIRNARGAYWGIKDPMLCYLLPAFVAAVAEQDEIKLVIPRRNPEESVASIQRMTGMNIDDARWVIQDYRAQREYVRSPWGEDPARKFDLDYNEAVCSPGTTVERLAAFVNKPVTAESKRMIDPSLRRLNYQ